MSEFDLIVIGAGPGGYVAAIRAAQLGLKTAVVERWKNPEGKPALGGTCLNVGCIPSKALLDSSHHYHHIKNGVSQHGITVSSVTMDVNKMIKRKDRIVSMLTQGIAGLFKKNEIEWLQGSAQIKADKTVIVTNTDGEKETYQAKNIIIATGSVPISLPQAPVDNERVVDSTGALSFNDVPRRLGVIGAGVIGLELGSVWKRLGSEVIILEAADDFLAAADQDIAAEAFKLLKKQGLNIQLGARVTGTGGDKIAVNVNYEQDGEKQSISVDKLIVAVGRKPNTDGLGAREAGLEMDDRGFLQVNEHHETSIPGIYAIGDVTPGPMLAHKASEEGMVAAEIIAGEKAKMNYQAVPWVIYTWPEIAWVGKTEQQLQAEKVDYKTGQFPFTAIGRARAMNETQGFVKILSCTRTDKILGAHILSANASELLAELVLAMEFEGSTEDIARTIHAHPTLSEALHEAALAVEEREIHM